MSYKPVSILAKVEVVSSNLIARSIFPLKTPQVSAA